MFLERLCHGDGIMRPIGTAGLFRPRVDSLNLPQCTSPFVCRCYGASGEGVAPSALFTRVNLTGTGQGSAASPLLANIYLHYVVDLSAERWRRLEATGDMIIVRYADDIIIIIIIIGFEHETDARRFWEAMRERLQEFSLRCIRTRRLIEFPRVRFIRCRGGARRRPQ